MGDVSIELRFHIDSANNCLPRSLTLIRELCWYYAQWLSSGTYRAPLVLAQTSGFAYFAWTSSIGKLNEGLRSGVAFVDLRVLYTVASARLVPHACNSLQGSREGSFGRLSIARPCSEERVHGGDQMPYSQSRRANTT